MHFRIRFVLLCACVLFITVLCACTSVPGENTARLKNIDAEYVLIANAYMGLGNYVKAIEYYTLARSNLDFTLYCDVQIARALALSKKWQEAQNAYEVLLIADSENTVLLSSYAYVLSQVGEAKKATSIYKTLIERNADDIGIAQNYILLLLFIDDEEGAIEQFELFKTIYTDSDAIGVLQKAFDDFAKQKEQLLAQNAEQNVDTNLKRVNE